MSGAMSETAIAALDVRNLSAQYGKRQVLFDVSLDMQLGELVAVLGHNGAGKTTLLRSILGMVTQKTGDISFYGRAIDRTPYYKNVAAGITYTPAELPVFRPLDVNRCHELRRRFTVIALNPEKIVSSANAVDGKIAGEHAAVSSEEFEDGFDDHSVISDCPPASLPPNAGDFDGDVFPLRKHRHCVLPSFNTHRAPIGRKRGVDEDDLRVGETISKRCSLVQMPPRRLKVEPEPGASQHGEAFDPARIRHAPGSEQPGVSV
jgi:hypothetical protein